MSVPVRRSSIASASGGGTEASTDNTVPSQYKILTLAFNQDCTSLAMGTLKTYSLFTISPESPIHEIHNCAYEDVRILERLFSSSLIALVSNQAPRKLKVCHFKKGTEICSYAFSNTILAVKLNRQRLIVCLEESIYIHSMRDMKVLHTIRDVTSNADGLCALSSDESNPYLAYPGSAITGEIQIFDTVNLKAGLMISAHESPLAAMIFDMSGSRIATASDRGTVIRIHSVLDGTRLFDFRRGVLRAATIYSMAFSPDSAYLATSSNTGTIHIFRLVNQNERAPEETNSWMGYFGRRLTDAAYYLPKQTAEVLTQDRSYASVRLQSTGLKTTIAMNVMNNTLKLFVAGYDGVVCVYEVNTNDGGECKQISQHLLFSMSQNSSDQSARIYPPNVLRNDNRSSSLSNERRASDQVNDTAIEEHSFPHLPSPPSPHGDEE